MRGGRGYYQSLPWRFYGRQVPKGWTGQRRGEQERCFCAMPRQRSAVHAGSRTGSEPHRGELHSASITNDAGMLKGLASRKANGFSCAAQSAGSCATVSPRTFWNDRITAACLQERECVKRESATIPFPARRTLSRDDLPQPLGPRRIQRDPDGTLSEQLMST